MAWINSLGIVSNWMLAALLVAVIILDLKDMRLPNWLALAFVALFALSTAWTIPLPDIAWRSGAALIVLLLGLAANAARLLGGGDVKILAALMLFIPTQALLSFMFVLCMCMLVGIIAVLALRRMLRSVQTGWRGLNENGRYPMGLSIGMAGLILVSQS